MMEFFEWNPEPIYQPTEWLEPRTARDFTGGLGTWYPIPLEGKDTATLSLSTISLGGGTSMRLTYGSVYSHGIEYVSYDVGTIEHNKIATFSYYYYSEPGAGSYQGYIIIQAQKQGVAGTAYRIDVSTPNMVAPGVWGTMSLNFPTEEHDWWKLTAWTPINALSTIFLDQFSLTTAGWVGREPYEWVQPTTQRTFEAATFYSTYNNLGILTDAYQLYQPYAISTRLATLTAGTLTSAGHGANQMKLTNGEPPFGDGNFYIRYIATLPLGKLATFSWNFMAAPYSGEYTIIQVQPSDFSTSLRYDYPTNEFGSGVWGTRKMTFPTGTVAVWHMMVWPTSIGNTDIVYIDNMSVTTPA